MAVATIRIALLSATLCILSPGDATSEENCADALIRLQGTVDSLTRRVDSLFSRLDSLSRARDTTLTAGPATVEPAADTSCWCTTPGDKRHNASCRYYRTTKGRPCGKEQGTPCRKCGG